MQISVDCAEFYNTNELTIRISLVTISNTRWMSRFDFFVGTLLVSLES